MKTLLPAGGLLVLRKEMDKIMDRFLEGDEAPGLGAWTPDVDLAETKEALTIRAEVPGMEPKDIQLTLENGVLILKGEKRQITEQKEERLYRSERHFGSFVRSLRLPANVDGSRVTATFKNGVVTVTLPKTAEARGKTIPITTD